MHQYYLSKHINQSRDFPQVIPVLTFNATLCNVIFIFFRIEFGVTQIFLTYAQLPTTKGLSFEAWSCILSSIVSLKANSSDIRVQQICFCERWVRLLFWLNSDNTTSKRDMVKVTFSPFPRISNTCWALWERLVIFNDI